MNKSKYAEQTRVRKEREGGMTMIECSDDTAKERDGSSRAGFFLEIFKIDYQ